MEPFIPLFWTSGDFYPRFFASCVTIADFLMSSMAAKFILIHILAHVHIKKFIIISSHFRNQLIKKILLCCSVVGVLLRHRFNSETVAVSSPLHVQHKKTKVFEQKKCFWKGDLFCINLSNRK